MKIEQFKEIFATSFSDPAPWRQWFFGNVAVNDDEIYIVENAKGRAAAALMMQRYAFLYHGAETSVGYISCVATRPEDRSKGLASMVLTDALADAQAKGFAMCVLIPAAQHLQYFYRRMGFATVFYDSIERYTSLHTFGRPECRTTEPSFEMMHSLEKRNGCSVMHSPADYTNILADMALDGDAHTVAVSDGERSAMLFAIDNGDKVKVKCLMADNEALADAALAELRLKTGKKSITVLRPPGNGKPPVMRPFGMARITDASALLGALAAAHPEIEMTIRLTDRLLPETNGIYAISQGICSLCQAKPEKIDLDITPEVLAAILFGNKETGRIFGLPTQRPYMALMLD